MGTTVKLLDKVFARKPHLKETFLLQQAINMDDRYRAGVDPLPEAEIDESVSEDYQKEAPLFAEHRARQEQGVSRWKAVGAEVLSADAQQQRRCVPFRAQAQ